MKNKNPPVRKSPELIKEGLFRKVYLIDGLVMKVKKGKRDFERIKEDAVDNQRYQMEMRKKFDFLPKYYGTIITSIEGEPISISFYEGIERCRPDIKEIFGVMMDALSKGFVIDPKLSNFGKKGEKVYYLDEYGIGRWLPPDVLEGIKSWFKLTKFFIFLRITISVIK